MSRSTETTILTSPDISCDHCVATVNRAISAIEGVTAVETNARTKEVVVTFDPDRVSEPQLREALDEAGYPAIS